jgi:ketosteroid isomerase-like protein
MPETRTPSPREVFQRLIRGIADRAWTELPNLYAEDATVDQPFAPAVGPAAGRLVGRQRIAEHFAGAAQGPLEFEVRDVVVHQTDDPEVIIAEFDYEGRVTTTGRPLRVANIQVVRVRGGKIVASRDYHNHLAIADALGVLPQIASTLTSRSAG